MQSPTRAQRTLRAFIRPWAGWSEKRQRLYAEKAGEFVAYVVGDTPGEREAWLNSLGAGQDGWIYDMALLAEPRSDDVPQPSVDYAGAVARLFEKICAGSIITEGKSGITSADPVAFRKVIENGAATVAGGRKLTRRVAQAMAKKSKAKRWPNSAPNLLKRKDYKKHHRIIRLMWTSPEYPNAKARAMAINEYLIEQGLLPLGTEVTIWRAFRDLGWA